MTRIEAVLFDADGVVQSTAPGWRAELAALCGDPGRAEEFLEDLFAAEKPCLTGHGEFSVVISDVLTRWGSTASVTDALRVWEMIEPHEDLLGIVDRLRARGFRVSLATNQQADRARFMAEELRYESRFDDLFFSCRIGHAKPSPMYFERLLGELALEGNQILFVDDHPGNVEAARQSGFNADVYTLDSGVEGMLELLNRFGLVENDVD